MEKVKRTIWSLILILLCVNITFGQSSEDKEAITTTINYYFEGSKTDNPETMKKPFHPDATLKYTKDGEYAMIPIQKYFTYFTNTKKREFEGKIHYIDVVGTAANVKITATYKTHQFTDYMNMIKLNEGWKIVSKISYRKSY